MRSHMKLFSLSIFIFSLVTGTCLANAKVPVFVTIPPQKYFVQQIGKDLVDVQVMVYPGADPHTYEPKPRQMVAISRAKLYFAVGVEFEKFHMKKLTAINPNLTVIHTDHGIKKLAMAAHDHHHDGHTEKHHASDRHDAEHGHHHDGHTEKHHASDQHDAEHGHHHDGHAEKHHASDQHDAEHGHEKEGHHGDAHHEADHHDHTGLDPHIWLSPALVKKQARAIVSALQDADPAHRNIYQANFKAFIAKIDKLDARLKMTLAGKTGLQFMVFHPAWGYFADAYGLKQVAIEIEGKDPKPAQLAELIKAAKQKGVNVIFAQPQFSSQSAEIIAREIGGQVIFADPLAEDWMANMVRVADKFQAALK